MRTLELIQRYLGLLAARDIALVELFAEEIDWHIQGDEKNVPWLGRRYGKDQLREFFQLLWSNTNPVSASIDHIFVSDRTGCITGEFSVYMNTSGNHLISDFSILLEFNEQDKIVKYRLLEDSHAVSHAY